ncbi:MAG: hypothetical protein KGV44_01070 [Flavobacteriaceae bacterium]|nr:hypothetical protein [Flavobacteriaceae bacterium]
MTMPYFNNRLLNETKKYFLSKELFSIQDIVNWLTEYKDEYQKVKQFSISCKDCGDRISFFDKFPFTCALNPTEEYKFYRLYTNLQKIINEDVEGKYKNWEKYFAKQLKEYHHIKNDKAKVKEWLIKNEDVGNELLYKERFFDESYFETDNNEETSIDTNYLYIEYIDDVYIFLDVIIDNIIKFTKIFQTLYYEESDGLEYSIVTKEVPISFQQPCLHVFQQKDTFSISELSIWLEENKDIQELKSIKYSEIERVESKITNDIKNNLNREFANLEQLIKILQSIANLRDDESVSNLMETFGVGGITPQIEDEYLNDFYLKIVKELKEKGAYTMYDSYQITIKIDKEELEPLIKLSSY